MLIAVSRDLHLQDTTEDFLFRTLWIRRNRGLLAKVAKKLGVCGAMVRMVFWGKRRSARVEAELELHGLIVGPPVRRRNVKAA